MLFLKAIESGMTVQSRPTASSPSKKELLQFYLIFGQGGIYHTHVDENFPNSPPLPFLSSLPAD